MSMSRCFAARMDLNSKKSLFEKIYQNGLNNLERDTAWYLDKQESVYWWHRIAVNQREYSLQGWQKQKVYPDLLVCVEQPNSGSYRFSILETKGEHLKGNDDTEYKRRLFELLTEHVKTAVDAGELTLGSCVGWYVVQNADGRQLVTGDRA